MSKQVPDAVEWLSRYLASGDATPQSRIYRAARQAGIAHDDVFPAARLLGVVRHMGSHGSWWRLTCDSGPPSAIPAPIPETRQWPRAEAGGPF
jgi:hypothetical protein